MKAIILGMGKSGNTAKRILSQNGYTQFHIYDDNTPNAKPLNSYRNQDHGNTLTVVSPGLNPKTMTNYPDTTLPHITNELDLCQRYILNKQKSHKPLIIAITGSSGKTTTATMLTSLLKQLGANVHACGNIGNTLGDTLYDNPNAEILVLELSSFQIDIMKELLLDAFIILNLAHTHQERYTTAEQYYLSKAMGVGHLKENGTLIINHEYVNTVKTLLQQHPTSNVDTNNTIQKHLDKVIPAKHKVYFGNNYTYVNGLHFLNNRFNFMGNHNLINLHYALFTISTVVPNYLKTLKSNSITHIVENIPPLPHRMEPCHTHHITHNNNKTNGCKIIFVNDSKSTNAQSVVTALASLTNTNDNPNIILLIGGQHRRTNYETALDAINKHAIAIYSFGEEAYRINRLVTPEKHITSTPCKTLREGVQKSIQHALDEAQTVLRNADNDGKERNDDGSNTEPDDSVIYVLMSPGSPSFDEFQSFEDRGNRFREYVAEALRGV